MINILRGPICFNFVLYRYWRKCFWGSCVPPFPSPKRSNKPRPGCPRRGGAAEGRAGGPQEGGWAGAASGSQATSGGGGPLTGTRGEYTTSRKNVITLKKNLKNLYLTDPQRWAGVCLLSAPKPDWSWSFLTMRLSLFGPLKDAHIIGSLRNPECCPTSTWEACASRSEVVTPRVFCNCAQFGPCAGF